MKPVVLALVGPTGSGKTRTAIRLCQALNAEIVSMDSMQVYRGMDIGTAKPTREELAAAPHHMIDVVEPDQMFTVSMYRDMACKAIDDILARGRMPLLVGGTGLYLQAISYELSLGELAECVPAPALDEAVEGRALGLAIDAFLDTVSKDSRVIFLRRYWFGDSVKEIARSLGMTQNAVSVRLNRTRQQLHTYLYKEGYLDA